MKICLKELRESQICLKIIEKKPFLDKEFKQQKRIIEKCKKINKELYFTFRVLHFNFKLNR